MPSWINGKQQFGTGGITTPNLTRDQEIGSSERRAFLIQLDTIMGEMRCDREGCDNTGSEFCILNGEYYLCRYCHRELESLMRSWATPITKGEVVTRTLNFLQTPIGTQSQDLIDTVDGMMDSIGISND